MRIFDASGASYGSKVDANNRLHVQSVSEVEAIASAFDGSAYNINTGTISLTGAGESAVLYFKSDEDQDVVIEAVAVGLGNAATTTDLVDIKIVRNPTAGTIVSDATAVDMNQNRNFGSNKTLQTTTLAYKGAEGKTFTDGSDIIQFFAPEGSRLFGQIGLVLPKGSSLGITIDPNISSGTMPVYAALILHLKDTASLN